MIDAAGGLLSTLLRFVAVTATTGVLGAWVFHRFVVPRLGTAVDASRREEWSALAVRGIVVSAAILFVSAMLRVVVPAAVSGGLSDGERVHLQVVWREALFAQAGAALGVAIYWGVGRAWERFHQIARDGLVLALVIIAPALAHAGSTRDWQFTAVLVDITHGLAAAAWIGALALLTIVILRLRGAPDGTAHATALFASYHRVAVVAAPVVFVTGLATAWLRMGLPEGIANPTYSGIFVAKLLLAGVAGYYGAGHSKLATKKGAIVQPEAISRTLVAECAFAVVVLMLTSLLLGTPPIG